MSEHISQLFSFNSGINCVRETSRIEKTTLPKVTESLLPNLSEFNSLKSETEIHSMDDLLRDALKPEIEDTSVLIPNKFYRLLSDTQVSLQQEVQSKNNPEVKAALSSLVSILEENSSLMEQFNHFTCAVQRV